MKIKKLKLENFRQYKNVEVDFSCDDNRNITVIVGNNTAGKTTLVNSFIWCLYHQHYFKDDILLNRDVAEEMAVTDTNDVKVTIELEHKNYSYSITTSITYKKVDTKTVKSISSVETKIIKIDVNGLGGPVPASRVNEEINSILSHQLKEYFFFDGENNSIEKISDKKNLTNAVSDLVGLKRSEELLEYFDSSKKESVQSKLEQKLYTLEDLSSIEYQDELDKKKEELEKNIKQIQELTEEIESLESQEKEKESILDANLDVEEDQKRKRSLGLAISENLNKKEKKFNSLIRSINDGNALLKILFSKSYSKSNLQDILEKTTFKSVNSLKNITEVAIDDLIKRGYCLCGTKITGNDDIIRHLISEKEHMEPHDFGRYACDFSDCEKNSLMYAEDAGANITQIASSLLNLIGEIDDDKDALKQIEKRISGRIDVGSIQQDIGRIKEQISAKEKQKSSISEANIFCLEEIAKCKERLKKANEKDEKKKFVYKCIDYADFIYDTVSKKLTKKREEAKQTLEDTVNKIFQKMYHGNRVIKIDDRFRAEAKLTNNADLDRSKGLETVKNFAFVAGLMKVVKEKVLVKDDDIESDIDISYPLVMDAPFSNTDEIHVRNICNILPEYCNQVIIVVMKKDYNAAKDAMLNKIGKEYIIKKKDNKETESILEEVL